MTRLHNLKCIRLAINVKIRQVSHIAAIKNHDRKYSQQICIYEDATKLPWISFNLSSSASRLLNETQNNTPPIAAITATLP